MTLFWLATALIVISQGMILRSTVRAMLAARSAHARRGIEWAYAIVPAVALVIVLLATWQAVQRRQVQVQVSAAVRT